ncbi:MAG TPA: DUF3168 domain-containing protein [Rhizorhapis sp.]
MSAAVIAVQAAAVAAMRAHAPLANAVSGVFDGPPPGVCFPYVTVGESPCVDWSHKSGRGREVRLVLTVWDDGARAARLHGLMREVEAAVEGMQTGLDGWRVVSLQFLRSRVVRDEKGPWAGLVQYRMRVMEE